MFHANFNVDAATDDTLTIRDLGPWNVYKTITNDAEYVVESLHRLFVLRGRRLLYYDSEGQLDELLHKDGKFIGFPSLHIVPLPAQELSGDKTAAP